MASGWRDGGQSTPGLILAFEEVADGAEPVPATACPRSVGSDGLLPGQEAGQMVARDDLDLGPRAGDGDDARLVAGDADHLRANADGLGLQAEVAALAHHAAVVLVDHAPSGLCDLPEDRGVDAAEPGPELVIPEVAGGYVMPGVAAVNERPVVSEDAVGTAGGR